MSAYSDVELFIGGEWQQASEGKSLAVVNPATGETIGAVARAGRGDLDAALAIATTGFETWKAVSAFDRSKMMRRAADLVRQRADHIARMMTLEQGKPFAESRAETLAGADIIDWFAEEARRAYGRIIPSRQLGVTQLVYKEPVGVVAAFTPWNFPINQSVRKVSAALAAGCSIILKGPEETPSSCAELIRAFGDAGIPPGAVNLVFGVPSEISEYLVPHPVIKKITFTGSTSVGKQLASLAGLHMKRVTMELGGHAPALVFADADIDLASRILSANKYRNAGQVCVSPTRMLVQESVFEEFTSKFVAAANAIRVGDGLTETTTMGPLANPRRVEAMERLTADAVSKGAQLRTGGRRLGNSGNFYAPTVLCNTPKDAKVMNEEPFGPLAIINRFHTFDEAIEEANRLPYGLASYAYTRSAKTAALVGNKIHAGMMSINHHGLALPETPFGGVKDSGYGSEGGSEAIEAYLNTKFVSQSAL
jgi:succinate-semialdehyde dehydrogenase / glutarate-semialdehyde dehydrogenase